MNSALLLAGEHGRVLNEVDGTPTIRRIATRLPAIVDEIVVSCNESQHEAVAEALAGLEYRLAIERVPAGGPIAALRTGFRVANGSAVAAALRPARTARSRGGRRNGRERRREPAVRSALARERNDCHRRSERVTRINDRPEPCRNGVEYVLKVLVVRTFVYVITLNTNLFNA